MRRKEGETGGQVKVYEHTVLKEFKEKKREREIEREREKE